MTEEQRTDYMDEPDDDESSSEVASLSKELAELKAKADANLAGWQRAQADFANYKRRSEQEKEDSIKFANANLVLKILPVLDDFERAVDSLPEDLVNNPWIEGIKHIERKLRNTLEVAGLSPIKAVGEQFDPRLHEAVREEKGELGVVVQEAQRGYKFLDRVIRASKVIVGNGELETEPARDISENPD